MIDRLVQDIRLAMRGLRRASTFTATALVVLGLGIGMAVAMFTVFRAVVVQRLPVVDQDRVVVMWTVREGDVMTVPGKLVLDRYRKETSTLRDVAGVVHWGATAYPLTMDDRQVEVRQGIVTGNFFDVLGVRPALGRLLNADDEIGGRFQPDSFKALEHPMVLSWRAWQGKFGGDSTVIGRRLFDPYTEWTHTIVGVAPPGLDYPAGVDEWVPVGRDVNLSVIAVGRLRPGVSPAAARDEYRAAMERAEPRFPFTGARVRTLGEQVLGDVRPALFILTAAVGLLLLIACINVGNLLLLRAAGRAREIAIRRAIGASYADVVRQLLVESAVLAAGGGLLGLVCAAGLLRLLVHLAPTQLPRMDVVRLEGAPIAIAVATTALAVLCFGVAPALLAARTDLAGALRLDARGGAQSRARRRMRELLVASQVALALMMVAGAGLLGRSLARLHQLDLGYRTDHLSFFAITLPPSAFVGPQKLFALGDQLFPRLRAIPGVVAVTPVIIPPLLGANVWQGQFEVEGQTPGESARNPLVPVEGGNLDYFRTMGIPLLRGRNFAGPDTPGQPHEAVVSESVARRFWPGRDPIGQRIRFRFGADSSWRTVVGIAGDIHFRSLRESSPMVFFPWRQIYWQGNVAIRTTGSLGSVLPAIRRALKEVDPRLSVWQAESMDELLAEPLAQPRLGALLLSGFGLVALLLAATGLYGVMATLVREQTRDIGVRIALGATPAQLRRDVLARAFGVIGAGVLAGVAAALLSARLYTALLFQVSPADPIALVGALLLLVVVGIGAAYVPARRATRVDPAQALRAD